MNKNLHVVTGAFGYSGRYMAHRLLDRGMRVRTLTNSRRSDPFAGKVEAVPLAFHDPDALARSLEGAKVLYNTYWVRFDHDDFSHSAAVGNTLAMFAAAKRAGVERIVHVSITNPSIDSSLPYFRGKAEDDGARARARAWNRRGATLIVKRLFKIRRALESELAAWYFKAHAQIQQGVANAFRDIRGFRVPLQQATQAVRTAASHAGWRARVGSGRCRGICSSR